LWGARNPNPKGLHPAAFKIAHSTSGWAGNNKRYHESLDNVTPGDVYLSRHHDIITHWEQLKQQTLKRRKRYSLSQPIAQTVSQLQPDCIHLTLTTYNRKHQHAVLFPWLSFPLYGILPFGRQSFHHRRIHIIYTVEQEKVAGHSLNKPFGLYCRDRESFIRVGQKNPHLREDFG